MLHWLTGLASDTATAVWDTFAGVWVYLLISIVMAAALTTYVGTDRLQGWLRGRVWLGVTGATALAVFTPFCACGTLAVVLAGLATAAPWAPLVAFIVSSPLTSPAELFLSAGLFGWRFALVFFTGAVLIGLGAGWATMRIEARGWLRNQARAAAPGAGSRAAACPPSASRRRRAGIGPGTASVKEVRGGWRGRLRTDDLVREIRTLGWRILWYFTLFTVVGYLVIEAVPTGWLTGLLGGDRWFSVPLAAGLGIPAYVNTEASLPMVAALMAGGMGAGPALAFLVTGAGTCFGTMAGLLVIARRRVVALVVALLAVSALAMGWLGGWFL